MMVPVVPVFLCRSVFAGSILKIGYIEFEVDRARHMKDF